MKKWLTALLLILFASLTVGCNGSEGDAYDVYVTVYPLEYLIDSLVEGTELSCGVVPGVSSHQESIDWSPKQIIAMTKAKYLFFVGANLDLYIDNQVDGIFKNKNVTLVKIETGLPDFLIPGIVDDHDHDAQETTTEDDRLGMDPHFWISPRKMIPLVDFIYDKLVDSSNGYPQFASLFAANRVALLAKLSDLDAQFDEVIDAETSRAIMTSTNLYGYLTYNYGLVNRPISPGYHEEADQFTTQQKEMAVAEAILHDIRHIIYEKNASSPLSNAVFDALAEYSGEWDPVKLEFNIMHSFALSDRIDNEGNVRDYYTVMLENLEVLKIATGYTE